MLNQIKDKILQTDKACGLEVSLHSDGAMVIQLAILKLKKNKIIREKEVSSVPIEELNKIIAPDMPVAVVVNGKGVLHKKVIPAGLSDTPFESILPNANPADFYLQVSRYDGFTSVYVIRKAILDKLIGDLLSYKLRILVVSMGVTDLQYLMPYINFEKETTEIRSNHFLLQMRPQGTIAEIDTIPFSEEARPVTEYSIGNYYVYPRGLMAFSAAMGLLAGSMRDRADILNAQILSERDEFKYFKYFKVASRSFLGLLFAILLVSFLVYSQYYNRNAELQVSEVMGKAEAIQAEKLQTAFSSKERFITQSGWDNPSRISFYADRIAALLPDDAQLTTLRLNPVRTSPSWDSGPWLFQKDTIQFTGTCENPTELNRFVNNLRNIPDFHEIDIKSYLYKKETQTGTFTMEIVTL